MHDNSSQTLICTSSGGPATSVTWSRDNTPLVVDGTAYQQSQVITDINTATYQNMLRIVRGSLVGHLYTCTVSNLRGNHTAQLRIKSKGEFTISCSAGGKALEASPLLSYNEIA
jgi:hypothetical protein